MKFELIHADGCSTNLGVIGAECNCGSKAQLESCEEEHKKVIEELLRGMQIILSGYTHSQYLSVERSNDKVWCSYQALKQKMEVE